MDDLLTAHKHLTEAQVHSEIQFERQKSKTRKKLQKSGIPVKDIDFKLLAILAGYINFRKYRGNMNLLLVI